MKSFKSLLNRITFLILFGFLVAGCEFIIAPPTGRPPSIPAEELRQRKMNDPLKLGVSDYNAPRMTDGFSQSTCGSYFNKAAPQTAKGGVAISTQFLIQGTILVFNFNSANLKSIQYKINQQEIFSDTGPGMVQNPNTGEPEPSRFITLPPDLDENQRHVITVRWIETNGKVHGPVALELDLPFEVLKAMKVKMEGPLANNWVAFRNYYDSKLLYFTTALTAKKALCEIRYSFDEPSLHQSLEFVPSTNLLQDAPLNDADQIYIDAPRSSEIVYVQLTYIDGSKSPIKKFDHRFAR